MRKVLMGILVVGVLALAWGLLVVGAQDEVLSSTRGTVKVESRVFNPFDIGPSRLTLNFTLPLQDPPGAGILGFATASRDNKPIILMETTIRSDDADVPGQEHEFERWLNSAHDVAGNWFFTLIRGNLLSNFERVNGNADA